ncbi:MAG: hypothetical protein KGH63_01525 [Candidatus Micrarchaeota archaeon]|nr:hypothetical protein [Candidatus Micrarchaeota archaeon]
MNFLQIVAMALRLWRQHLTLYTLAALMLFLCAFISAGLFSGALLTDALLALAFGPSGAWAQNPLVVLGMLASTVIGFLASTVLLCAGTGAYLRSCAQIAAGSREVNLMGFVEYASAQGLSFWFITMCMLILCAVFSVPVAAAGILFSSYGAWVLPLSLVIALSIALLVALPFWLSYSAQVVHRKGALPSLLSSVKASAHSPVASLVLLVILLALFFAPMVSLVFYPIYFFLIFMPVAGNLMLVYYEAAQGLLHEPKPAPAMQRR